MTANTTTTAARVCAFCAEPIPDHRNAAAIYCHGNCSRKATYLRKTPEERAAINRRSNQRRFEKDLLPIIRGVSRFPDVIPAGSPMAKSIVQTLLLQRFKCWKWELAFNYASVQNLLVEKAGGFEEFERLEDLVFDHVVALRDQRSATS